MTPRPPPTPLTKELKAQLDMIDTIETSQDGRWVLIRNIRGVAVLTKKMVDGADEMLKFVENEIDKMDSALEKLDALRDLVHHNKPLRVQHLNRINFLEDLEVKVKDGSIKLKSIKLKSLFRRFLKSLQYRSPFWTRLMGRMAGPM